ncbi:hypothetical protein FACS1894204_09200 [Synergistales bacterium]|nr:hypothetical protein FACS1894204_09200 [Synergistales bacterium]
MIFDKELMFLDDANIQDETSVTSDALDLGTKRPFHGRVAYLAIAPKADMTATDNPDITVALEFADNAEFTNSVMANFPIAKKADFESGKVFCQPIPFIPGQFARLDITVGGTNGIACAELDAGIVLDPEDPIKAE